MVKDSEPEEEMIFSEQDLDLPVEETIDPSEEVPQEATADETQEDEAQCEAISLTSLAEWFEKSSEVFDNVNQVKVSIRGIDSENILIMAVKDGSGEKDEEGNDKRVLRVFEKADTMPVLDLAAISMDIYNNGFRIIHQYSEDLFIKTYGVKTGLICVFCTKESELLIPYYIVRVKRKDENAEVVHCSNTETIREKLPQQADLESLQLLYKQSSKAVDELSTNQSVISWLTERQDTVTDINHHLQIDNVIINILS